MLTEFALDESFLESDDLRSKSTSRNLLKKWKEHGVLVFGDHQDEVILLESLKKKIPAQVYQEWIDAFADYKTIKSSNRWKIFCDYDDYTNIMALKDHFKTGITEPVSLELIHQLPNYICYCPSSKFEVVEVDDLDHSENFQQSILASNSDIDHQDDNEKIWKDKFEVLSKFTKNIVIIDQYFLRNIIEDKRKGRKTSIDYLFEKLSLNGKKYNITIISLGSTSGSNSYVDIIDEFTTINVGSLKNNYNKLHLISCNANYFRILAHDRFIQFDDYVCTLGKGLDVLRSMETPQCTFSMIKEENSSIRKRVILANSYKHWEKEFLP
ncbi:hypothetical protein HYG93_16525 [Acinetobacter sp. SwsAc6]|uniref:hypothetical protein n=1 Tax=Acinetobacter sp. SwsAc6 TaxID=2749439 RepID=UPI0015C0C910|nr:hypothetical protein [Acinetobacter sp. SwsAc6]NWK75835.1 hypothetical protein [Acinetobacter sp. SwsAc6]